NFEHVFADDAAGDANVFGVRAVVEEEVFAKIGLALAAEKALIAGGGIRGDDAHAFADNAVDGAAFFLDGAGELVAEQGRRLNHALVETLLPDFEVGAAGESDLD